MTQHQSLLYNQNQSATLKFVTESETNRRAQKGILTRNGLKNNNIGESGTI